MRHFCESIQFGLLIVSKNTITSCQYLIEREETHSHRNIVNQALCVAILQRFSMIRVVPGENRKRSHFSTFQSLLNSSYSRTALLLKPSHSLRKKNRVQNFFALSLIFSRAQSESFISNLL